jgi:DsbC/DsbD-like thiol-disulfide interchange protein/cytochrome c biogenesis protein CcdA
MLVSRACHSDKDANEGVAVTRILLAVFALSLLGAPTHSRAAESAPVTSARATATLITDTDAIASGTPFRAALRLRLAPGWHTYWKNPGDAGVAPQLALAVNPPGMVGDIAWPAPARQPEGPVMTYGYSGEVVLPVTVVAATNDRLKLKAQAQWLVCSNICVPEEGTFKLSLPIGTPAPSAEAALFAAADSRAPRPSPWRTALASDGTLNVEGAELSPATVKAAWFIPDGWGVVAGDAPQPLEVASGHVSLRLPLGSEYKAGDPVSGLLFIQDASGLTGSYEITAPASAKARRMVPFATALWFALLGGIILNLMPCVFPVLAMKAMALARLSTAERSHARGHALAYTAGVLTMFAALGGLLIALRAGGVAAGWGFQFQSPVFVAVMAWLLFAVGLNLAGLFAIGPGASGVGSVLAARGGHVGSFFTGLLAVLVATPCTAPFMAVALGAALTASPAQAMAVFLALGLGLASPYLALAAIPALARALPRPGHWMETLRKLMAIPMFGAAVWLVWVVSEGSSESAVALTSGGPVDGSPPAVSAWPGWSRRRCWSPLG